MALLPHTVADTALSRLFSDGPTAEHVSWFSLPGGQVLCETGEVADNLYFVRTGRLAAIRHEEGQEPQFLGVIRPGEPAGEMALIAGAPHSASVVALRDSEILALPRDAFFDAAEHDPELMIELARLMLQRARQTAGRSGAGDPSVFGFVGCSEDIAVREFVESIAREIASFGYSVATAGEEALAAPTEWFSNVEQDHDFVLYSADHGQTAWKALVSRQVDRLFRVGRGDAPPPPTPDLFASRMLQDLLVDLVLIQPRGAERPSGSEAWVDAVEPARLFHLRDRDRADLARLARTIAGLSLGLVLSGGGARAYAHIGAIAALREAGVPVDFVGGASMGSIIAAGVAMGWDDAEIDARIREAFVDTSPVDDVAFPIIAMSRGEKVRARLKQHFGETQISDLWLPFFCVSSNLTSGAYQLHRRGTLRRALRASIAIPGLLPPAIEDGNVLVDGAVMKTFPSDIMRSIHLGPIVGIDVTRGRSVTAEQIEHPPSFWRFILSGAWREGPPIVSLLLRAATVTGGRDLAASRLATDVLVAPKVDAIEIRDWKAYEPAVAAGHEAMATALAALPGPVTDLRRRQSLEEKAAARTGGVKV
ncbi:MAG TPA: patatin-like phospholipase family protein [Caulobacteraceae bacterium]|nr:patatin-like phospholipase family protein [Caulobacteraceae bacterium]